jgi:integrating conjugative element protein (TIGR03765 family)
MKSMSILILLIAAQVNAKPEIIADFGGRPSGVPDVSAILKSTPRVKKPLGPVFNPFPVESHLQLGKQHSFTHDKPVDKPFFIIGGDAQSLRWLSENYHYFLKIQAKGLITNLNSQEEFDNIQTLFPDVRLMAVNVDDMTTLFGIQHYPVFINKTSVEQ